MVELIAVGIFLFALFGVAAFVTWKKGRRGSFWLGFLVGGWWFVSAFRLARPESAWALRFYSPEKMERARHRFEETSHPGRPVQDSAGHA